MPLPTFETSRLTIRPWSAGDGDSLFRVWGDPAVIWWGALTRDQSDEFLQSIIQTYDGKTGLGWWAVEERGQVIGDVVLKPAPFIEGVELGYHFARAAWGNGYARESSARLLRYALDELALERVFAIVHIDNERSLSVIRALGFARLRSIDNVHGPHHLFEATGHAVTEPWQ